MDRMSHGVSSQIKLQATEVYGNTLCELAAVHPDVVALSADLAKSTKTAFMQQKFPERFFNVGIAEQNMFGIAAGMAKAGLTPFVSTFAIFTAMRGLDQVHTDICYQNLNVKMVATHAGLSFGAAGSTHHCTEDISIMRTMANCNVIVPADAYETGNAVRAAYDIPGPVYIRINRGSDRLIYDNADYDFKFGKAREMAQGTDVTIIACGPCVYQAMAAAAALRGDGIKARVLNMHTIKPIDREAIMSAVEETGRVVTVEDHSIIGGLGSAVAEVIAESGEACVLKRLGVPDCFAMIGLHEDIMAFYKTDANGIAENARLMLCK